MYGLNRFYYIFRLPEKMNSAPDINMGAYGGRPAVGCQLC